ncbi:MAG: PssD/Cps14F family polysaccharide biosynthesis glycosyltransferase [Eubacteriales bacterium]|nr:PssD/Cps14F family polysaccharide biosynthesis glycosyltransferase [Eubacteriales bacterium]
MRDKRRKKICFAASCGGHYEQLMMLKPLMEKYDSFVLTEKTQYDVQDEAVKLYRVPQVNRKEKLCLLKMLWISMVSLWLFIKEKPEVVVCTGVLAMIPICLIMKLFGRKVIYIESFAMIHAPTRTGRLLYPLADRFYVQWESMKAYYPNAIYLGAIY